MVEGESWVRYFVGCWQVKRLCWLCCPHASSTLRVSRAAHHLSSQVLSDLMQGADRMVRRRASRAVATLDIRESNS